MASGPYCSLMASRRREISSSASSQEVRSHSPDWRLPLRRSGYFRRSLWYTRSVHTVPDMQQDAAAAVATAADALEHRGGQMVGYQTRLLNVHACNLLPGLAQVGAEHVSPTCKIGPFHGTLA